jgi:ATP-dependent Lhr-like helicase
VGSVANAAKVIAALTGEKRLVFCDSRRLVEQLGVQLRERGVTTYLIHASLSLDERQQAKRAFAEGQDCGGVHGESRTATGREPLATAIRTYWRG